MVIMLALGASNESSILSFPTNGLLVKLAITSALHAEVLSSSLSWSTHFSCF